MLAEHQIGLPALSLESAEGKSKAVLEKALAQVGFIPNMYARMANSPALLDTYLHGYAAFRNDSGFTVPEQELIFLVISHENGCEYCVSAHSFLADMKSKLDPAVTDAVRDGQPIPEPKLATLANFTRTLVKQRGLPSKADVQSFVAAGYGEQQILEIVLAISVKTLSNYANHLFHTPLDPMFETRRWADRR